MRPDDTARVAIGHITLEMKSDRIDASCGVCHMGMEVGEKFGSIPGNVLIAEWVKQHKHPKKRAKP